VYILALGCRPSFVIDEIIQNILQCEVLTVNIDCVIEVLINIVN